MKYTQINGSEHKISGLALGTWVFSGTNWGGSKEDECIEAVHAAIDHGISIIDTAPIYGYGLAETIVGKAIKGRRDKIVLATKCGLSGRGKGIYCDLKAETVQKEIEDSLARLQTDYIDIYQCHWPDVNTPIDETFSCLEKLKEQGKIKHIGVSNFQLPLLKDALGISSIATLQSPLSMLDRKLQDEILPFCAQNDVGVLTYGSLGGGILSGKYQEPPKFAKDDARTFFYKFYAGDKFNQIKKFLEELSNLGKPLNHIALNWAHRQEGVLSVIVGARNANQVMANVDALTWDMDDDQLLFINNLLEKFGL